MPSPHTVFIASSRNLCVSTSLVPRLSRTMSLFSYYLPRCYSQIQKCSLERNVTSAIYKLLFSNVLHTYKTKNKVLKVHEAENLPLVVQDEECVDKMGVLSDQH